MEIIEHNGKIAATFGWSPNRENPIEERTIFVSDIKSSSYPLLIGKRIESFSGNVASVFCSEISKWYTLDMNDWRREYESRPVKKPRRGKRQGLHYDWEWLNGKWVRKFLD